MSTYRYLAIEGGAILEKCKALQAEHMSALSIAFDFAKSMGASGVFTDAGGIFPRRPKVIGLSVVSPLPPGWKKSRDGKFMEPYAKTKEAKAKLKALPDFPDTRTAISEAIGWDPNFVETDDQGHTTRSWGMPYAQLLWTGDKFCAAVPLHDLFGHVTDDGTSKAMSLPVPDGCREISESEWALIKSQEQLRINAATNSDE